MNKILGFLALIFILCGLGLGIVSVGTNSWAEKGDLSTGFFQTCNVYPSAIPGVLCYNNLDKQNRDKFIDNEWYLASVGSHCGGVLAGFFGMVLWFTALCGHSTGPRAGAIIFLILSFAGFLAGVILWKFKYIEDNSIFGDFTEGYSFWVAVGAAGSMGISTILAIVAAISHRKK